MTHRPSRPLDVLFIWHFHQPYYGVPGGGDFILPWVRLHAAKSYYDMGRLLESHQEIRSTFNFSGSLLRQLQEYVEDGRRDRWWRWSHTAPEKLDLSARRGIVRHFFSLSRERHIEPMPRFRQLFEQRQSQGFAACAESFTDQDFLDLQVLFNLAWCGFSARRDFPILNQLRDKGGGYSIDERDSVLDIHLQILSRIIPIYGGLARSEQIEISVTPMYHPIIPLLIDTESAARATPDRPRPPRYRAPEDARWHVETALELATSIFGRRPRGMWPSEGSVSPEAAALFRDAGLDWIATDEEILARSRGDQWNRSTDLWHPWRLGASSGPKIFFRDHGLSDRIGFSYANNTADEATRDLVQSLESIRAELDGRAGSVAIILDGENPWEHYEDDGGPFLTSLYERLVASQGLRTNLPSQIDSGTSEPLDHLHSGSWIMANYQIWIGHDEMNEAWRWLARASSLIDEVADARPEHPGLDRARQALHMAQGSDWFWWYGDDFSSEQDDQFDAIFRSLVAAVWTCLDEFPPPQLNQPIYHNGNPAAPEDADITAPRRYIEPTINGLNRRYFEWIGAGQIIVTGGHGSMYESFRALSALLYGFSPSKIYLRLQPGADFSKRSHFECHLRSGDGELHIPIGPSDSSDDLAPPTDVDCAFVDVAEISIPLKVARLSPGDPFALTVCVYRDGLQVQRFPSHGAFDLRVPEVDPSSEYWMV